MERAILHADMNNCYASIELIDHPSSFQDVPSSGVTSAAAGVGATAMVTEKVSRGGTLSQGRA